MKTVRLMQRKKEAMQRKGCLHMDSVMPYDMSVTDHKKCNIQETLMTEVQVAATFYLGSDPYTAMVSGIWPEQCRGFVNRFGPIFLNYQSWFAENEIPLCP